MTPSFFQRASLCALVVAPLSSVSRSQEDTIPKAEWELADKKLIEERWDSKKFPAIRAQWEKMKKQKMCSALFVADSGYTVLSCGEVDTPIRCHSVRKSFLNALYGKLDQKKSLNLDATLLELKVDDLTPLNDAEKAATIFDLLKCRSGVYLPAEYETASMTAKKPKRGSHARDTFYYYNNWDFNALGGIYNQLSQSDVFADFDSQIAKPLGMQDFSKEKHTAYNPDPGGRCNSAFPAYTFTMSTRDRARFGLLYLRNGNWGGNEILSPDWIKKSITPFSNHQTDPENLSSGKAYGLLWWVSDTGWLFGADFGGTPYSARGNGGQYIAVVPSENVVIAISNDTTVKGWVSPGAGRNELMKLISEAKR